MVAQFGVQEQAVPQAQTDWVWAVASVLAAVSLVVPSVLAAVSLVVPSVVAAVSLAVSSALAAVSLAVASVVAQVPAVAVVSTDQSTVERLVQD